MRPGRVQNKSSLMLAHLSPVRQPKKTKRKEKERRTLKSLCKCCYIQEQTSANLGWRTQIADGFQFLYWQLFTSEQKAQTTITHMEVKLLFFSFFFFIFRYYLSLVKCEYLLKLKKLLQLCHWRIHVLTKILAQFIIGF